MAIHRLVIYVLLFIELVFSQSFQSHIKWPVWSSWTSNILELIPTNGLALLVDPGAQMIQGARGNKRYPALIYGDNIVVNGNFHDFTMDISKYGIGEDSPFYVSDFSAGTDGWTTSHVTIIGNVDGIYGEDDVLKAYADAANAQHRVYTPVTIKQNQRYRVKAKVYIPSTNTTLKKVNITDLWGSNGYLVDVLDTWVDVDFIMVDPNHDNKTLTFLGLDINNNPVWTGAGSPDDDVFYVKDLSVQKLGAVAYWVFDDVYHANEGTGKTILQDLSGNGHDLTAGSGFDWQNQLTGTSPIYQGGHGLEFDGIDDYAYIPAAQATDFNPGTGDFSISAKIQLYTDIPGGMVFFGKKRGGSSNDAGYGFFGYINNSIQFRISDGTNIAAFDIATIGIGNWANVCAIKNGTNLLIYYNGSLVSINDISAFGSLDSPFDFIIAKNDNPTTYTPLIMGDAFYFNRALTDQEAKEISSLAKGWTWDGTGDIDRDGFQQVVSGGGTVSQTVTTIDNTLYKEKIQSSTGNSVSYFGETTSHTVTLSDGTYSNVSVKSVDNVSEPSATVYDYSGNDYNGTAYGGFETAQPVYPYAWELDGINDYVDFGDVLDVGTKDLVLFAWTKNNSLGSNQRIISKQDNSLNLYYIRRDSDGRYEAGIGNGSAIQVATTNTYSLDWHFVAAVFDRDGTLSIYVDGNKDGSIDISSIASNDIDIGHSLMIGSLRGESEFFSGKIGLPGIYIFNSEYESSYYETSIIKKIYNNTKRYFQ